jgi:hypothetical protein
MISLPSKRAQSIIVILLGVTVGIVLIFGQNTVKSGVKSINTLVVGEKVALPENPNWQEDFGKATAGTINSSITLENSTSASSSQTLTDTVSRSLMANYLVLKQNGSLDANTAQNLVTNTAGYIQAMKAEKITVNALNLIPDNGQKTMTEYGDRLGNIIKSNRPAKSMNEVEIIKSAVQTRNTEEIKELEKIALIYSNLAKDLQKMPVPQKFARAHLDIVNSLLGISGSLNQITKIFEDPMQGLAALQTYQESASTYVSAHKSIIDFLTQNKISYKQGSGGYYLMHGI